MPENARKSAAAVRAYRERLAAAGRQEVLVELPRETVALLDELKVRHKLRSRSQALEQLISQGGQAGQANA